MREYSKSMTTTCREKSIKINKKPLTINVTTIDAEEEKKHIVGYTQPKGKSKTKYKVYDTEGYIKYGMRDLSHWTPVKPEVLYGGLVKTNKKIMIYFD